MVNNYFYLKQGQLPPLHSGPSLTSITPRNVKPSHSSPEKSSSEVVWLERKEKNKNEKEMQSKSLVYFLLSEFLQVFHAYPSFLSRKDIYENI